MNWFKKAKDTEAEVEEITDEEFKEMEAFFEKRTNEHIGRVQKFSREVARYFPEFEGLIERNEKHDQSKFEEPERTPYIYLTWKYKCQDEGVEFNPPADIEEQIHEATLHHIKHNPHHPEAHIDEADVHLNKEDRDKPPEEMVDGTKMSRLDVADMCVDWMSMSEEKGGTPQGWADNNVNVRWKFTDEQKDLIYEVLDGVW